MGNRDLLNAFIRLIDYNQELYKNVEETHTRVADLFDVENIVGLWGFIMKYVCKVRSVTAKHVN